MVSRRFTFIVLGMVVLHSPAWAAKPKKEKPDLGAKVQENTVWRGVAKEVVEEKPAAGRVVRKRQQQKQQKPPASHEATVKITKRDGEKFEAEVAIIFGKNRGANDRRVLQISGTIDKSGQIKSKPSKMIAGAWPDEKILDETWNGSVSVINDSSVIVLRRQAQTHTMTIEVNMLNE